MKTLATVNLTVRVDEVIKKDFDTFCENVGLNATAAVNMFIKTVVRTRALPFTVTDVNPKDQVARTEMLRAVRAMQEESARNGNSEMTLDEINAEIAAARQARRNS